MTDSSDPFRLKVGPEKFLICSVTEGIKNRQNILLLEHEDI